MDMDIIKSRGTLFVSKSLIADFDDPRVIVIGLLGNLVFSGVA